MESHNINNINNNNSIINNTHNNPINNTTNSNSTIIASLSSSKSLYPSKPILTYRVDFIADTTQ